MIVHFSTPKFNVHVFSYESALAFGFSYSEDLTSGDNRSILLFYSIIYEERIAIKHFLEVDTTRSILHDCT